MFLLKCVYDKLEVDYLISLLKQSPYLFFRSDTQEVAIDKPRDDECRFKGRHNFINDYK